MKEFKRYGGISKLYYCPICDQTFLVPFQSKGGGRTQWVYKRRRNKRMTYYCSYHCYKVSEEVKAI